MAFNQQDAFNKVVSTIKSCETHLHLKAAHQLLLNYIKMGPLFERLDPFYIQGIDVAELKDLLYAKQHQIMTYEDDQLRID